MRWAIATLLVGSERHALLVDGERDDRGSVAARHGQHQAGALLAVFQVDGVDDGLAGNALERLLDDVGLGGIHQDGRGHAGGDFFQHRVHVALLVFAHDGAAEVEHLRTFGQPAAWPERECRRSRPARTMLRKCSSRVVVFISSAMMMGCASASSGTALKALAATDCARHRARRGRDALQRFDHRAQMFRRGAAAAAHHLHAVFRNKAAMIGRQLRRRELVDRVAAFVLRQSCVRLNADRNRRVLA